jgi:hypothetical protein
MKYKIVIFLLFGVFMVETKVVRDQNKFTVGIAWTFISYGRLYSFRFAVSDSHSDSNMKIDQVSGV